MGFRRTLTPYGAPGTLNPSALRIPLDVVEYGGLSSATATIAAGANAQMLAVPTAGTAWRVHSICGFGFSGNAADYGGCWFNDGPGGVHFYAMVVQGRPVVVLNRLVTTSFYAFNGTSHNMQFEVGYDTVTLPVIQ